MPDRVKELQSKFKSNNIDCFLVTSLKNIYYLTGFTGDAGILFISPRKVKLITDYRFQGEVVDRVHNVEVCLTRKKYFKEIATQRVIKRKDRIGFESRHVSYNLYWELRKKFDWLKFKSFDSFIEDLRVKKTKEEIKNIKKACEISDKAFLEVLDYIKPGVREIEIAAELEYRMKKLGGEKVAFDTIVASGFRSSIPHGTASDKKIKRGEFVVMDFSTYYRGYASDMTRTVFVGTPTDKDKNLYDVVYQAQKLAREATKEGTKLKDLDRIARNYIENSGYGKYFTHSLGHGVGLDVHEAPVVSIKNHNGIVENGMVFTIEPGIYLPEYQGIRIEDIVAIRNKRGDVLTNSERELIVL